MASLRMVIGALGRLLYGMEDRETDSVCVYPLLLAWTWASLFEMEHLLNVVVEKERRGEA